MPDEVSGSTPPTSPEIEAVLTFEDFYLDTRTEIGRAVALVLGNPDLAAEATDEAYTRACERWARIRGGNPSGWVYRVALNWALSVLRQHRRSPHRLYQPLTDDPGTPEPAVHTAMAALDPKHRSVVVCRHLLGWSVAETAAALRIREGTVKSRLFRANQVLAAQLHHLRPESPPTGPRLDPLRPPSAGGPAAPHPDQEQP